MANQSNRGHALALIKAAGGRETDLFPADDEEVVHEMMKKIPSHHREIVHRYMGHQINGTYRLFAAAAAAIRTQELMQPNSAATFYPATLAPGATATPGTVYPLVPFKGLTAQNPFSFVRGQRFFGLMTGRVDTQNGWCIAANSLLFSIDAISGIDKGDASFANWEEDVVLGRTITGEYQRHEILEQINFTVSAVLRNAAPQTMVEGLTVSYWDKRCMNDDLMVKWFGAGRGIGFDALVRELMAMADDNLPVAHLVRRLRSTEI
jgi:hypothetical protein